MSDKDVQIDPRGYRFGANVTLLLAVIALVLGLGTPALVLVAVLVVMFIPGAIVGPQATIQSAIFKRLIRPRIGAPKETESFRPPRFAQQLGLFFSTAALVFGLLDVSVAFYVFLGFLVFASFLNGVLGFCLGCEIYLLFKRLTAPKAA